jgi:hypothetical protein
MNLIRNREKCFLLDYYVVIGFAIGFAIEGERFAFFFVRDFVAHLKKLRDFKRSA